MVRKIMKLSTVAAFKNINSNSDKFIHIKGDVLKNFQKELTDNVLSYRLMVTYK